MCSLFIDPTKWVCVKENDLWSFYIYRLILAEGFLSRVSAAGKSSTTSDFTQGHQPLVTATGDWSWEWDYAQGKTAVIQSYTGFCVI